MRFLRNGLMALLCLLMAAPAAMGQGLSVPPRPQTRVLDQAGVMTEAQRAQLENKLAHLKQTTGVPLIVFIGTSLQGEAIETYSTEVFHAWGIGQKGTDNGLLYMLFINEPQGRRSRFTTGYGTESVLPDGLLKVVQANRMRPFYDKGQWFEGVQAGIDGIQERLSLVKSELPAPAQQAPRSDAEFLANVLKGLLTIAAIIGALVGVVGLVTWLSNRGQPTGESPFTGSFSVGDEQDRPAYPYRKTYGEQPRSYDDLLIGGLVGASMARGSHSDEGRRSSRSDDGSLFGGDSSSGSSSWSDSGSSSSDSGSSDWGSSSDFGGGDSGGGGSSD